MISRYFELVLHRGYAEFRSEASQAYLGFLWWFLEPILYLLIFYVVFALGLRGGGPEYVSFLLSGLVAWKWFGSSINRGTRWLNSNKSIIQEIYIPKWVLVAIVLFANTIKFLIIFVIFVAYLLLSGDGNFHWLGMLIAVLVEAAFIFGLAFFAASIVPFLPDLRVLVDNGLTMLFFMSGIFFDIRQMAEPMRGWLMLNPMVSVLDAYRASFIRGEMPDLQAMAAIGGIGVLLFGAGLLILKFNDRRYPRVAL